MGFLIPQRATTRNANGELLVWVVAQNNQVKSQIIKVSHTIQDQWVVLSGLNDNNQIVVEGYQRLSSGAEVETSVWEQTNVNEQNAKSLTTKTEIQE